MAKEFDLKKELAELVAIAKVEERHRILAKLEKFEKEIESHLSGDCGVKICEECKKLEDGDICLIELKKSWEKLKESIKE